MTPSSPRPSLRRRPRLLAASALVTAGVLVLGACGSDDGDNGGDGDNGAVNTDAPLYDQLPESIREAGKITVGSDIAYAPIEYYDENNEVTGIDPAIADAMAEQLGVPMDFVNGTFDGLVLGMNSGRYDVIMSAMTDTRERQEGLSEDAEGGADFVNYFEAGSALLVAAGNPEGIATLDDLCGLTVASQRGTSNEALVERQGESCDEPIEMLVNDTDDESITQLQSGRAQVVVTDFPVALYNATTARDGELFEVVGEQIDAAPYGIAVPKDNPELRDALQQALQAIIDDGTYQEVLAEWDAETGAIESATVNAGQ
ncbi:transporter substrate-binding domain-containing protein [Streptomyces alkaliphilus]|uniref:Transporter substrate-binding domain-containing protein n=1 Tax=Streptomyces alkaliphilus TaxID=1472722 RepID=A0A7W3THL9_9ACTN|nr:ABC transporter substrate-binding protein [Streptomyces alkaliphilus]MBB0246961.1 transporter substrate-binding domain-containing protein [Streptomyces alkaliphilus]